jgi:hypothetical protein
MTFAQIAQSITPVGYAAAIVGLVLCVVVVVIRFRSRNLAGGPVLSSSAPEASAQQFSSEPPKPKSAFKTFVQESEDSGS